MALLPAGPPCFPLCLACSLPAPTTTPSLLQPALPCHAPTTTPALPCLCPTCPALPCPTLPALPQLAERMRLEVRTCQGRISSLVSELQAAQAAAQAASQAKEVSENHARQVRGGGGEARQVRGGGRGGTAGEGGGGREGGAAGSNAVQANQGARYLRGQVPQGPGASGAREPQGPGASGASLAWQVRMGRRGHVSKQAGRHVCTLAFCFCDMSACHLPLARALQHM